MFTLRCTQKLLKKLGLPANPDDAPETTTKLGDWYANTLNVGRGRYILCMSERSLLAVVVAAKDVRQFPIRIRDSAARLLEDLGCTSNVVAQEVARMDEWQIGRTRNRTVLGTMTDFAFQAQLMLGEGQSLRSVNYALAETPCGAMDYMDPGAKATEILSGVARKKYPREWPPQADWQGNGLEPHHR